MHFVSHAQVIEALHFVHLIGLCIGLGGALFGDFLGLCLLFSKRTGPLTVVLRPVHSFVLAGLAVLWLTGVVLALTKFGPSDLPVKVIAKLVLASLLLVNAYFIGKHLLPLALSSRAPMIRYLRWPEHLKLIFFSSVSAACWLSALLLVKFSPLQQMTVPALLGILLLFWGLCALVLFTVVAGGRFYFSGRSSLPHSTRSPEAAPYPRPANDEPGLSAARRSTDAVAGQSSRRIERIFSPRVEAAAERSEPAPGVRLKAGSGNKAAPTNPLQAICWRLFNGVLIVKDRFAEIFASVRRQLPERPVQQVNSAGEDYKLDSSAPILSVVFSRCRKTIIGIAGVSAVTNILMLTGPIFMLQIYDRVLTSKSVPTLAALVLLVALLFCFMGALELVRSRVLVRIGLRIDQTLSKAVFDSVLHVGSVATKVRTRVLQDLDHLRQFVSGGGPAALFDIPWVPLYFLLIFMFHWALGLVALAGALVLACLAVVNEYTTRAPVAAASQHSSRALALAESGWRNADSLHAMGMIGRYRDQWLNEHRKGLLVNVQASDLAGTLSVLSKVSRLFLQSMMLATGAYLAIQQAITPGVIIAASIIMSRALAPIEQSIGNWRSFLAARQGFARISATLENLPDAQRKIELPSPKGFVVAEKLFVAAPGQDNPILKGANFSLEPGDCLAVIGTNGSGKSTLARALVGVWPARHGQVRLDGAALSQWVPEQLGASVGYLPQSVELFEGTVADNIARFDPEARPEDVVQAAQKARVHDLILRLPDGYGTVIGEDGASLSGGQRQRIGLARAFYGNPVFVVLDEPASNLDGEGEAALDQAIATLRAEKATIVLVAHKARTIAQANLVLVLENGRQTAFDTKEKVLKPAPVKPERRFGSLREQPAWRTA